MKAEQQPSWTIYLQAKAKNFDLKFKATRCLPTCYNLFQFSLFLNISSLFIRVSSVNNHSTRRKSLKSKITGIIEKFRCIPTKKKTFAAHKSSGIEWLKWVSREGPINASTVVIANLALLIQSMYEKDMKGIILHCLSIMLYILTQLRTFMGTKKKMLLLISILAMVGYPLWLHYMKSNWSYGKRSLAWRFIGKAWNWAASNAFLHAIAQVIQV